MNTFKTTWIHTNRKSAASAFIAALILLYGAFGTYTTLAEKVHQQQDAFSLVTRWKVEYELLKPVKKEWNEYLISSGEMTDLYHVYGALKLSEIGLSTNQETVFIDKIDPVIVNQIPLGASRICLKTASESGLAFTAPHFSPDLFDGLKKLAERRDIEIQNIQLSTANGIPKAVVNLCLVIRT